jgi:hypothetical protein
VSTRWLQLLDFGSQPESVRETYELLSEFVEALASPSTFSLAQLDTESTRRLGYLVMATRLMTHANVHPTWRELESLARAAMPAVARPLQLFKAERGVNMSDDLAGMWRLRRGVDSSKLVQIATSGAC